MCNKVTNLKEIRCIFRLWNIFFRDREMAYTQCCTVFWCTSTCSTWFSRFYFLPPRRCLFHLIDNMICNHFSRQYSPTTWSLYSVSLYSLYSRRRCVHVILRDVLVASIGVTPWTDIGSRSSWYLRASSSTVGMSPAVLPLPLTT